MPKHTFRLCVRLSFDKCQNIRCCCFLCKPVWVWKRAAVLFSDFDGGQHFRKTVFSLRGVLWIGNSMLTYLAASLVKAFFCGLLVEINLLLKQNKHPDIYELQAWMHKDNIKVSHSWRNWDSFVRWNNPVTRVFRAALLVHFLFRNILTYSSWVHTDFFTYVAYVAKITQ